ncbi:nucleoside/nucleotide kinase family protein [Mangrovicoccus ximenensis]|uniref:AAA family ATPase n=1 Tax=Mangrovicoccus ximenensis TaxID=1911570 RepID=UPI00191C2F8F|nr:AAA family ATPase [Mangrovicoccus ximenensis]
MYPASRASLIAVAGAPGSGKSRLAEFLAEGLNAGCPGRAEVVPMDGFHYDDAVLAARGLLPRKGSPETFDVAGFDHLLARLRANDEPEVAIPVFDRSLEISRAGARMIGRGVELLVVEGNYLLLGKAPWDRLARHFDETVFLDVPADELERRLRRRWTVKHALPPEEAERKLRGNDLPNGETVRRMSRPAGWTVGPAP